MENLISFGIFGIYAIVALVVLVPVFLIIRKAITWYFRLNDMIDRLDRIIVLLDSQPARPRGPSPAELLEQVRNGD